MTVVEEVDSDLFRGRSDLHGWQVHCPHCAVLILLYAWLATIFKDLALGAISVLSAQIVVTIFAASLLINLSYKLRQYILNRVSSSVAVIFLIGLLVTLLII